MSSPENEMSQAPGDEAQLVVKARTACEMAEMSLDQLSDEYERERFEKWVSSAELVASSISDPFYRSAAIHPLVVLMAKAGNMQKSSALLESIQDEMIRSKVEQELVEIRAAT